MNTVKIAGVPEHFNYPFHLALQEGAFEQIGIDLQWVDVPEGTGRMSELIDRQEVDMAIMLTEGTLRAVSRGVPLKIVQTYVESPLLWGVHTGIIDQEELIPYEKARFAVSRMGSGSHLMAKVMGLEKGIELNEDQFTIVNTLEGALELLDKEPATYFMWERFTTHPYVEAGRLIRQEDFPTPWPCFVWVATEKFAEEQRSVILSLQRIMSNYTKEFMMIPSVDKTLSNYYSLPLEQIHQWMSLTKWSQKRFTELQARKVESSLLKLGVIEEAMDPRNYLL